jgi:hypothetical protein
MPLHTLVSGEMYYIIHRHMSHDRVDITYVLSVHDVSDVLQLMLSHSGICWYLACSSYTIAEVWLLYELMCAMPYVFDFFTTLT